MGTEVLNRYTIDEVRYQSTLGVHTYPITVGQGGDEGKQVTADPYYIVGCVLINRNLLVYVTFYLYITRRLIGLVEEDSIYRYR